MRPSIGPRLTISGWLGSVFSAGGISWPKAGLRGPFTAKPVKQLRIELVGAAVVYATLNQDAGKHLDAFELHCLQPVSVET